MHQGPQKKLGHFLFKKGFFLIPCHSQTTSFISCVRKNSSHHFTGFKIDLEEYLSDLLGRHMARQSLSLRIQFIVNP